MNDPDRMRYILYADDDTDDRNMLVEAIKAVDPALKILTFENGLDVMQYLSGIGKTAPLPSCIILDINMPIWDGLRTLRALKDDPRFVTIPACVLTSYATPRDATVCEELGAKAFYTKPAGYGEIREIAKQMMSFWS